MFLSSTPPPLVHCAMTADMPPASHPAVLQSCSLASNKPCQPSQKPTPATLLQFSPQHFLPCIKRSCLCSLTSPPQEKHHGDGVGDGGWGMEGRGCGVCVGVFPLLTDVQALERHTHRCSVNTEMNVLQPAGAFGPPSTPLRG